MFYHLMPAVYIWRYLAPYATVKYMHTSNANVSPNDTLISTSTNISTTSTIYTLSHTHPWLSDLFHQIPLLSTFKIINIADASALGLKKGYSIYEFMKILVENAYNLHFTKTNHLSQPDQSNTIQSGLFYTSVIACGRRVLWPNCSKTSTHLSDYSIQTITDLLSSRRVRIYHIFSHFHATSPSPQIKIKFGYLKFSALSKTDRLNLSTHLSNNLISTNTSNHDNNTKQHTDLSKLLSVYTSQYIESSGGTLLPINTIKKMLLR